MTCTPSGQTVSCTGTPDLAVGASLTVSYTVNVAVGTTGTKITVTVPV